MDRQIEQSREKLVFIQTLEQPFCIRLFHLVLVCPGTLFWSLFLFPWLILLARIYLPLFLYPAHNSKTSAFPVNITHLWKPANLLSVPQSSSVFLHHLQTSTTIIWIRPCSSSLASPSSGLSKLLITHSLSYLYLLLKLTSPLLGGVSRWFLCFGVFIVHLLCPPASWQYLDNYRAQHQNQDSFSFIRQNRQN